jgi:anti-sigma regulatory factor (Ser/Thr protein kinase)
MLIEVSESSQTGEARRRVLAAAGNAGMNETRSGAAALAATEMATNLVKHSGGGHIFVQTIQKGHPGLRLISADKGPGIRDITRALSDGHSTAGSMGTGLGAIRRLSDAFDLYSIPDSGTVIRADFWNEKTTHAAASAAIEIGVISEPIRGEDVCGDGWGVRPFGDGMLAMVVDGLGHGIYAAEAAREAERALADSQEGSLVEIIRDTHAALKTTRGAAFGLARINNEKGTLAFAGVGNISASVVAPGASRSLASHNGILGQQMERVQEFTVPWNQNSILILHSDGLASRWDLERYPGIWNRHASVIAALLHRDFCRGRDDVTVLVAKTTSARN